MVRLILDDSGFPATKEALISIQQAHDEPINEMLKLITGNRVLAGVEFTDNGDGTVTYTAGFIYYNGDVLDIAGYTGVPINDISIMAETVQMQFDLGTPGNPNLQDRDAYVHTYAEWGDNTGGGDFVELIDFRYLWTTRKNLDYLTKGTVFVGTITSTLTEQIIYTIEMPDPQQVVSYLVLGNFRAATSSGPVDLDFTWSVKNKTKTSFEVLISGATNGIDELLFEYLVVPMTDTIPEVDIVN